MRPAHTPSALPLPPPVAPPKRQGARRARGRPVGSALAFALGLALAASSPARGAMLTDGRFGDQIAETRHRVRATVHGVVARTEVTLSLRSRSDAPEEAILTFETPPGARVTGLWLRLRGRWVPAARLRAESIRRPLPDTRGLRARPDPAWLEQVGPDRYRLRVYPVPPRRAIAVRYAYLHPLALRWGVRLFVYPSRGGGRRAAALVTLIDHGLFGPPARRRTVIRVPARLTLERPLADAPIPSREPLRAALFHAPASAPGAAGAALLLLQGNPAASARRWGTDVVFVVDGSRSLGQKATRQIPALIRGMVSTLGPQTRVGLVRFGRGARRLTRRLLPAANAAWKRALARLVRLAADNGSSLRAGLHAGLGLLGTRPTPRRRLLVVITDGLLPSRELDRGLFLGSAARVELLALVARPGSGPGRRLPGGPLADLARRHAGLAYTYDPQAHGDLTDAAERASTRAAVRLAQALVRPGRIAALRAWVAGVTVPLGSTDLSLVDGLLRWVPLPPHAGSPAARITFSFWGRRVTRRLRARPMPRAWRARLASLLDPRQDVGVSPRHSLIVLDPGDPFAQDRLRFARRWGDRFFSRFAPAGSLALSVGPFARGRDAPPRRPAPDAHRVPPGQLTRAMVRRLLAAHFLPAATRCYQATGPAFRLGRAVLRLELTRGEVVDAWLTHDTMRNPTLRRCLLDAVARLRVPLSWADETLYRVTYPMRFRPADRSVSELRGWKPPPPPPTLNPLRGLR